jgi:CheY-like chemotaxis protein
MTVLYVEDEKNDALFMEIAFTKQGLGKVLRLAGDGQVAMDYLAGTGIYGRREEHPIPALVLLDLNLPAISGFEVLEWMRERPQFAAIPVVIFSSSDRDEDRARARELGAVEFIEKPSSGIKFSDVVERVRQRWLSSLPANGKSNGAQVQGQRRNEG